MWQLTVRSLQCGAYLGHKLVVAQHVVGILEGLGQQHLAILFLALL